MNAFDPKVNSCRSSVANQKLQKLYLCFQLINPKTPFGRWLYLAESNLYSPVCPDLVEGGAHHDKAANDQ
jgi:hypothetical protein